MVNFRPSTYLAAVCVTDDHDPETSISVQDTTHSWDFLSHWPLLLTFFFWFFFITPSILMLEYPRVALVLFSSFSTFTSLIISSGFMVLVDTIQILMTPKFISPIHIIPVCQTHIQLRPQNPHLDTCLIGISNIHIQNQTLFFTTSPETPSKKCSSCNFYHLNNWKLYLPSYSGKNPEGHLWVLGLWPNIQSIRKSFRFQL